MSPFDPGRKSSAIEFGDFRRVVACRRPAHRGSAVPSLHDDLPCDLSALQIDHCRTEHFCPIRIGTALREGQTVSDGHAGFDLVSHVASADVVKIRGDGAPALKVAWLARRIVTIDDLNNGILRIETGERGGLAPLDRALE